MQDIGSSAIEYNVVRSRPRVSLGQEFGEEITNATFDSRTIRHDGGERLIARCTFNNCTFGNIIYRGIEITDCEFSGCNLSGISIVKSKLTNCNFSNCSGTMVIEDSVASDNHFDSCEDLSLHVASSKINGLTVTKSKIIISVFGGTVCRLIVSECIVHSFKVEDSRMSYCFFGQNSDMRLARVKSSLIEETTFNRVNLNGAKFNGNLIRNNVYIDVRGSVFTECSIVPLGNAVVVSRAVSDYYCFSYDIHSRESVKIEYAIRAAQELVNKEYGRELSTIFTKSVDELRRQECDTGWEQTLSVP